MPAGVPSVVLRLPPAVPCLFPPRASDVPASLPSRPVRHQAPGSCSLRFPPVSPSLHSTALFIFSLGKNPQGLRLSSTLPQPSPSPTRNRIFRNAQPVAPRPRLKSSHRPPELRLDPGPLTWQPGPVSSASFPAPMQTRPPRHICQTEPPSSRCISRPRALCLEPPSPVCTCCLPLLPRNLSASPSGGLF